MTTTRDRGDAVLSERPEFTLDEASADVPVLRVYGQVFSVLAREAGAMVTDVDSIDVDQAILDAFAEAGSEGLTVEQAVSACRQWNAGIVRRRFDVLREYRAISKVVDRPNERVHRAAFAPYVMLLFLRRMAERGGQSELHQLLALERLGVQGPDATQAEGAASVQRLAEIFRLLGSELAILATGGTAETLGENAQLIWGNEQLIGEAGVVHAVVLDRWPELARDMILGLRYAPARFIENRLLTAAGAAEVLHRGLRIDEKPLPKAEFMAMRAAMLDQVPEAHRDRFKGAIRNDPTLRGRLHALAARPDQEAIARLVPDVAYWAKRTTRARNDLAHEGQTPNHSIEELIAIVEVTTAIVILNVLHELGLPAERQREIVGDHPRLRMTSQTAREWLRQPEQG